MTYDRSNCFLIAYRIARQRAVECCNDQSFIGRLKVADVALQDVSVECYSASLPSPSTFLLHGILLNFFK